MPVLNGIEATKIIKSTNKNIPIIAQTAYVHDDNKKAIMRAGCDEFIPKPINTDFFISVLEKFLD
jgi:CheY-like chemotaxis protein